MTDIAIKVENLTKEFQIGQERSGDFRESFGNTLKTMLGTKGNKETFTALERVFLKTWLCPGAMEWWGEYKHVPPPFLVAYIAKRLQEVSTSMKPFSEDVDWYKND